MPSWEEQWSCSENNAIFTQNIKHNLRLPTLEQLQSDSGTQQQGRSSNKMCYLVTRMGNNFYVVNIQNLFYFRYYLIPLFLMWLWIEEKLSHFIDHHLKYCSVKREQWEWSLWISAAISTTHGWEHVSGETQSRTKWCHYRGREPALIFIQEGQHYPHPHHGNNSHIMSHNHCM